MALHQPVLGIDIGGTHIRLGIVESDFSLHGFEMTSSACLQNPSEGAVGALAEIVRAYCDRHMQGHMPVAVSIGFPSTLNKDRTRLLSTPNLAGLDGVEVVPLLQAELNTTVYINRDVNLLLINDTHLYGLQNCGIVIGCYIGTGLGNAISIHGDILCGANGVAGELGHVPVYGNRRPCSCGGVGCMETLASGKRLVELQRRFFPDTPIGQLFEKHADSPALREYVDELSIPIATEITLLDPDCAILGGGVLQMLAFPINHLKERIASHVRRPLPHDNMRLLVSAQNQESGVVGAGMYALTKLWKEEKQ